MDVNPNRMLWLKEAMFQDEISQKETERIRQYADRIRTILYPHRKFGGACMMHSSLFYLDIFNTSIFLL